MVLKLPFGLAWKVNEMEVVLLSHTPNPQHVCAVAMMGCQSVHAAHELAAYELPPNNKAVINMIEKAKLYKHLSVLEHATFTFSVKDVSRVLTHQLVRHRIASFSQSSGRARDFTKLRHWDFIVPPKVQITHDTAYSEFKKHMQESVLLYTEMIEAGIPREDARFVLPQATPQNITFTMNARELLHFFWLRCSEKAQWEIREMANKMLAIVKKVAPTIFEDGGKYEC